MPRALAPNSAALNGTVIAAVGTATHYHTDWVAPYWAPRLSKIVKIGTHIFYRWNGAWGLPTAFTGKYSGIEPVEAKMAGLSTFVARPEVEVFTATDFVLPVIEETATRPPVMISTVPSLADANGAGGAQTEQEATAPSPVSVVQRAEPVMANPMESPVTPARRPRQRIATPSSW